jgi:ribosomal protein S1
MSIHHFIDKLAAWRLFGNGKSESDAASATTPDLTLLQCFAGVTMVGRVTEVKEQGVSLDIEFQGEKFKGFAPFTEFRDQSLANAVSVNNKFNFVLVFPESADPFLRVLTVNEHQSSQDWPIKI